MEVSTIAVVMLKNKLI